MNRILACIDASSYAGNVCDISAWAAGRLKAGVEILHVVQRADAVAARNDLSGAIGLGVKSALLEELTRIDEAEGKLAIERGRIMLESAKEKLHEAGVGDVVVTHRHGGIVETIAEREMDADLVVLGKRGASHEFAADHLGSKVERVIRASAKPVLLASRRGHDFEKDDPSAIVVAFDGSAAATNALDFVAESKLFAGLPIHVVIAGADDARNGSLEADAQAKLQGCEGDVMVSRRDGSAEDVIASAMKDVPEGLLVMGAYGHSPLRSLIVGSTTTTMIRTVPAPVLLVRP